MRTNAIDSKGAGKRNEKIILNHLKEQGPLSQSQLCAHTGLGSSTVSYIVGRLREKELINEIPGKQRKRGPKPVIISINPKGGYIAAVEINPTNILVGLFDFQPSLVDSVKIPLDGNCSVENVINAIEINVHGLAARAQVTPEKILGLGVTLSGSVSPEGVVKLSSPLAWKNVPLRKKLSERFDFPVNIYPTRVRLLAEFSIDPSLASKNVLYLNVSNGVGSTVFIDGNLAHGSTGRCGELGHVIVQENGPKCGCGHFGCLEALISGPALAAAIKKDINNNTAAVLKKTVKHSDSPEEIIDKWGSALKKNDKYAIKLRDFISEKLASVAAIGINCYDPEILMLGGYVCQQCTDKLAASIKQKITTHVFDNTSRSIEIIPARSGKEALIKGVAVAVLRTALTV
jgi:predicted NBD/HSP70 family sugar kinase